MGSFLGTPGDIWSGDGNRPCLLSLLGAEEWESRAHVMRALHEWGDAPFINAGSRCSRAGVGNPRPAGAAPPSASKFPLIPCSCSFWLRWQSCGNAELELLSWNCRGCSRRRGLRIPGCLSQPCSLDPDLFVLLKRTEPLEEECVFLSPHTPLPSLDFSWLPWFDCVVITSVVFLEGMGEAPSSDNPVPNAASLIMAGTYRA